MNQFPSRELNKIESECQSLPSISMGDQQAFTDCKAQIAGFRDKS